jgi:hypothetical protein
MPYRFKHTLLTFAAVIFLVEAWLWDKTIALGRWAMDLAPWPKLKEAVVRQIERLPPYGALPLFLIPVLVIEPLKFIAITQITHGHFMRGLFTFIILKFVGVGLIAFIFELTREKLLAIDWFARFYGWVIEWRDIAHDFIEPYKAVVLTQVAEVKVRLEDLKRSLNLSAGKGGLAETLARIRARAHRKPPN